MANFREPRARGAAPDDDVSHTLPDVEPPEDWPMSDMDERRFVEDQGDEMPFIAAMIFAWVLFALFVAFAVTA
jgi:hypothetical protein